MTTCQLAFRADDGVGGGLRPEGAGGTAVEALVALTHGPRPGGAFSRSRLPGGEIVACRWEDDERGEPRLCAEWDAPGVSPRPPHGAVPAEELFGFAWQRADRLVAFLTDVRRLFDDPAGRQLLLVEADASAVERWIALAAASLPAPCADRLTYVAGSERPFDAPQQIIGLAPGLVLDRGDEDLPRLFRIHDATGGASSPPPAPDLWAAHTAQCWLARRLPEPPRGGGRDAFEPPPLPPREKCESGLLARWLTDAEEVTPEVVRFAGELADRGWPGEREAAAARLLTGPVRRREHPGELDADMRRAGEDRTAAGDVSPAVSAWVLGRIAEALAAARPQVLALSDGALGVLDNDPELLRQYCAAAEERYRPDGRNWRALAGSPGELARLYYCWTSIRIRTDGEPAARLQQLTDAVLAPAVRRLDHRRRDELQELVGLVRRNDRWNAQVVFEFAAWVNLL